LAAVCTARQTPAPIEYLLRKAGLGQEESMPSSGRLDFMSQRTPEVSDRRREGRWSVKAAYESPASVERRSGAAVRSTDLVGQLSPKCVHISRLSSTIQTVLSAADHRLFL